MEFEGATVNLSTDWTPTVVVGSMRSTFNGSGTLIIASGNGLWLAASTINTPVVNQGALLVATLITGPTIYGDSTINGELTTMADSIVVVGCSNQTFFKELSAFFSFASIIDDNDYEMTDGGLVITNGFTNNGEIRLYYADSGSHLAVTGGTLTNASGGNHQQLACRGLFWKRQFLECRARQPGHDQNCQ